MGKVKSTIKGSIPTQENDDGKKVKVIEDAKLSCSKFYYGAGFSKLINHIYTCIENDNCNPKIV